MGKHGRCPDCQTNYRRRFDDGRVVLICRCNNAGDRKREPRDALIALKLTAREKADVEKAVARDGRNLSQCLRTLILEWARA